ncbi:double-strand break repair helicase AddA [Aureimonas fodinaquatilis]|uniref:DNA 3'-5' helicase n=1 Tax=Aureimonas fodinaquatilis TaxID=2565783 RepID=A0A5B0DNR4_9HYPH|nr:double-strand break repair helicase AddA [Aureimonas fodinaquatilis]KAA0968527.1 double-strand break repair helicase AddA [Aureimonas fodinaquatilis]
MSGLSVSAQTGAAQALASDPARSVFVAANAGSGKTHVLTRRVVRLLLANVQPNRILCLTYTKAAAAEMQGRVFDMLSRWTQLDDASLAQALAGLGATDISSRHLAEARRLFARALETPGGLKIQTIHAFCEAILHQFPLEANVPGHFEVLDDAGSALLLAEARRLLITGANLQGGSGANPALTRAFADVLELSGEDGLNRLIAECVARRDGLNEYLQGSGGLDEAIRLIAAALDVDSNAEPEAVLAPVSSPPGFDPEFRALLAAAASSSDKATDQKLADRLQIFAEAESNEQKFAALCDLAFKADGNRYALRSIATAAVVNKLADLPDRLELLWSFLEELVDALKSARLLQASAAALTISCQLEIDYRTLKARRGRLDFEDLIVRTANLLLRREASAWVHYKLDRGIDHVLVDEAQDTSQRQWQVIRALVDEFFHGGDDQRRPRTVFAVGDEKQSIYSFQGASPAMFADERRRLEALAHGAGLPFDKVSMHQSFRSASEILLAVDHIFDADEHRRGLSSDSEKPVHATARTGQPGLVEVWPVVQPMQIAESEDWQTPIDHQPQNAPVHRLARRIAGQIDKWVGTPVTIKGETRPLNAGDVIVLVRKRSAFVGAMGAALRELGNPAIRVAGADRLTITDHLAVQDMMALGRTVSNAEDELSLAEVLKSPLFDFTDDDLMALALSRRADRPQALYLALRLLAAENGADLLPDFVVEKDRVWRKAHYAFNRLEELRGRAGYGGVFSFYARILGPEGGRTRLASRLGRDTGEVLDAFLDLALKAESEGQSSLDSFLANLAASPPTVRREMAEAHGEVRIMTVHASKGLEAPVVFLVDPGSAAFVSQHAAKLIEWEDMPGLPPKRQPGFLWVPNKTFKNRAVETLAEREKQRAEDEYRRLFYVGLTRAADRLVVCGLTGKIETKDTTWLKQATEALGPVSTVLRDARNEITGWRFGELPQITPAALDSSPFREPALRPIDLSPLPPEKTGPRPLAPSAAGGQYIEEADAEAIGSPVFATAMAPEKAILRGQLTHRLLQVLPELPLQERQPAGERFLEKSAADWAQNERAALLASVTVILEDPQFAALFQPGSRAEVAIAGTVSLNGRSLPVNGLIDRLAIDGNEVLLVDYKTNRPFPARAEDVPKPHRLQLALYAALLAPLYPQHRIRAALLYTHGPALLTLNSDQLRLET